MLIISIVITSCGLEEEPEYSLNSQTIFSSKTAAETSLIQCYGYLANDYLYGQRLVEAAGANGVYWARTDGSSRHRTITMDSYPEDDTYVGAMWKGFYKVVAESNYLIDGLKKSGLPEDYKNRGIAHAHFLRGYAYYMLGNLFGKAPIILEPITSTNLHTSISSRANVYTQAETDLLYAVENLPEKEVMEGIANKNTAIGFLTKLYFILASQKQAGMETSSASSSDLWTKVKSYGDKLIGKYSLEPNYANLWTMHVSGSKESIFQLNFSDATGIFYRGNFLFAPNGYNKNATSWSTWRMDKAFYNYFQGTHPYDPRMETIYMSEWTNQKNNSKQYTYPYVSYNDWSTGVKVSTVYDMRKAPVLNGSETINPDYDWNNIPPAVKKHWSQTSAWDKSFWPFSKKSCDLNAVGNYNKQNVILLRYADLLLMLADAENELGNTATAVKYVNQVLTRARNSGNTGNSPKNISASMSQGDLRDFIFFERMFELAGEPILYEDIRRRGIEYLRKVVEIHNRSNIVKYRYDIEKANNVGGNFRAYMLNDGNVTDDFLTKNLVLPIPSLEINYNDLITGSDQNIGY